MSKIPRSLYSQPILPQVNATVEQTSKQLAGLISFGKTNANSTPTAPDNSNIQCWKATGTTPGTANTEFAISHNLMWIPWFYFFFLDRDGNLYQGPTTGTAWTAATNSTKGHINLKCSVASANYVIIII